jgi:hypothetical protein
MPPAAVRGGQHCRAGLYHKGRPGFSISAFRARRPESMGRCCRRRWETISDGPCGLHSEREAHCSATSIATTIRSYLRRHIRRSQRRPYREQQQFSVSSTYTFNGASHQAIDYLHVTSPRSGAEKITPQSRDQSSQASMAKVPPTCRDGSTSPRSIPMAELHELVIP